MTRYEQIIQIQAHELAESKRREAEFVSEHDARVRKVAKLAKNRDNLDARVKTLEDALRKAHEAMVGSGGFDIDQWTAAVDEAKQALAAKEPK